MGHLRAVARIVALFLLAVLLYAVFLVGLPFTGRWGPRGQRWRVRLWRAWARAATRLLGIRVEVRGPPPEPPFVLVANHVGYMDIVLLAGLLPSVFVSRADVRQWPVVGYFARAIGTVFLDRTDRRALRRIVEGIKQRLGNGVGVIFFPEGTSTAGDRVLPFRPPLLAAAVETGTPVSFASLGYETAAGDPPASRSVCWWGDMTFPGHFYRLSRLRGFRARVAFGERPIHETDRKALAARAYSEVARLHRMLVSEENP